MQVYEVSFHEHTGVNRDCGGAKAPTAIFLQPLPQVYILKCITDHHSRSVVGKWGFLILVYFCLCLKFFVVKIKLKKKRTKPTKAHQSCFRFSEIVHQDNRRKQGGRIKPVLPWVAQNLFRIGLNKMKKKKKTRQKGKEPNLSLSSAIGQALGEVPGPQYVGNTVTDRPMSCLELGSEKLGICPTVHIHESLKFWGAWVAPSLGICLWLQS